MKGLQIDPSELAGSGSWSVRFDSGTLDFGEASLERLGGRVRELGCSRVLLVTDRGIRAAGHVDRAERSLADESVDCRIFDDVIENPTTHVVEEGRRDAETYRPDGIVALGGGSSMDCAKGVNFLYTNGGRMEDYWGTGKARRPMLPSVGIPTTAGTGSEAQSYALISQDGTGVKMACGDSKARFRAVILDPLLLASTPAEVRGPAAMDAVSHAVESFVTTRRNPLSQLFAREAWRLLASSLEASLDRPTDPAPRGPMLLGAHFAGWSIEHSMLGAAHACANPLTAEVGLPHGIAVGLMLPHIVRFNREMVGELYAELERIAAPGEGQATLEQRLDAMRQACGIAERLRDYGVVHESLDGFATQAARQWTATFNPRTADVAALRGLYEAAF